MTHSFLSFVSWHSFLLFIMPLMLCTAYCRDETPVVRSVDDLNKIITEMAMNLEQKRQIRLEGQYRNKDFETLVQKSMYSDFATKWLYWYKSANSAIKFTMEYHDGTRILAAYQNPKLEKELSIKEKNALKVFAERIERFRIKHMKRSELVRVVVEDSRLRRHYRRTGKETCADFFISRMVRDDCYAFCIDIILEALGIPSRVVYGTGKRSIRRGNVINQRHYSCWWIMVQLEDGAWYHVMPSTQFFFVDDNTMMQANYTWSRNAYPEALQSYQSPRHVCKNHRDFWKEAQKAYSKGQASYTAVVRRYRGKKKFEESFTEHIEEGGSLSVEEKYLPGTEADNVLVHVIFSVDEDEKALEEEAEDASESVLKAGKDALKKFKNLAK